jgi:phosphatidate cytidylyltransferase
MSSFLSRVLVALVGLPVVLLCVYAGGWWLFTLVTVAALVAVHEYVTMARPLRPLAPAAYVGTVLALVGAEKGGLVWMLGGFLSCFVAAFLLNVVSTTRAPATAAIGSTVLGAAWIGFGLGHLILLRRMHDEPRLLAFAVLLTVFAADTFAYFAGRLAGRRKMAPTLSPGKTWEGFVAGSLVGVFVAFVTLYSERDHYLAIWQAVVLGLVVVAAAAIGDLFESMLKRDMQVKDTGSLLGGHGGVLDRVDALLFASAAAFYLVLGFHYG